MSVYTFWIIICSIICVTLVMLTTIISADWKNSEETTNDEEKIDKKVIMLPPIRNASDSIKYTKCGEALQNNICNQKCFKCPWNVKGDEENGERNTEG